MISALTYIECCWGTMFAVYWRNMLLNIFPKPKRARSITPNTLLLTVKTNPNLIVVFILRSSNNPRSRRRTECSQKGKFLRLDLKPAFDTVVDARRRGGKFRSVGTATRNVNGACVHSSLLTCLCCERRRIGTRSIPY